MPSAEKNRALSVSGNLGDDGAAAFAGRARADTSMRTAAPTAVNREWARVRTGEATGHLHTMGTIGVGSTGVTRAGRWGGRERSELTSPATPFGLLTHHTPVVDGAHRRFERAPMNGASTHRFRTVAQDS